MADSVIDGTSTARDQRVASLEAEVQLLTSKATQAADRLADYEEEIRHLKTTGRTDSPLEGALPAPPSRPTSTTSRFSLLYRSVSSGNKPLPMAPSSALSELQAALARETQLRVAAERKVAEVEGELEDLSATLFKQANEMVATERREKAKLEERVKVLEKRDRDKSRRVEMIEAALNRLERVRKLLDDQ